MNKMTSQAAEETEPLESIGAPFHIHTDRISEATFHFVLDGGAVHWLGASLHYDAHGDRFVMQSYEGGEHSLARHSTDAERLQTHWRVFLARHLIVVEELNHRAG